MLGQWHCKVILMAAALLLPVCLAAIQPEQVTDQYGNVADGNSDITFAELPDGESYETDPSSYSYNGLKPLFNGMHGFVNICFGEIPYDLLMGFLDGSVQITETSTIMSILQWGYGYGACLIIGLLFMLIFPIVGCCFCCCRTCCKNCGGKMVQKRKDNYGCGRACYFISLIISIVFLGTGTVCVFVTNERMSNMFGEVSTTVKTNVGDLTKFLGNTVDEVQYVALDGFNFTARVIVRDLDNIGTLVGDAVEEDFNQKANVKDAFDALLAMDPLLEGLITDLESINTAKADIVTSISTLETAMSTLADEIDTTFSNCGANCGSAPSTADLRSGASFDPATMPSFDAELAQLQAVRDKNITALVLEGKKQFDDISGIVDTNAASIVSTVKDTINGFDSQIESQLSSITSMLSMFDSITNITDTISDLEEMALAGDITVGTVMNYFWMGGVGLTAFVLFIFILQLVGVLLGCMACLCCGDSEKLPTERSGAGNCGGCFLMASVGFIFIFGALIMLLVWIFYLPGALMESALCANLRDPEYTLFKKTFDGGPPGQTYQTLMGAQDGYTLGNLLFQNGSVPLTIGNILDSCKEGETAWNALHLEYLLDLDMITGIIASMKTDVETNLDALNVDLSSLQLLDAGTKSELQTMSDQFTQIDFDGLIVSLETNTVTVDFTALKNALQTAADQANSQGANSAGTELQGHITEIERIEGDELAAVSNSQQGMLTSVKALKDTASTLDSTMQDLFTTLETTQNTLQTDGVEIVKNQSKIYASRVVGVAEDFINYVVDKLKNDIGDCTPVYNLWQSVFVNMLCGSVIDSFNAVWFSLGWCLAFMVLGLILSVKLAKHIRRMDELHEEDPMRDSPPSYEMSDSKDNKVHPA